MKRILGSQEFFIGGSDLEESIPKHVQLQGMRFTKIGSLPKDGTYGEMYVYSSGPNGKKICVKVIDEDALYDEDTDDVDINNGLGEIEAHKWLRKIDPKGEMFVTMYAPHRDSIIGITSVGKLLYSLQDIRLACREHDVKLVHYTVMDLYEGNLFRFFDMTCGRRRRLEASRELEERILHAVCAAVNKAYTSLESNGYFYKDLSSQQILYSTEDGEPIFRLADFANICQKNAKKKCDNYGAVVPPRYKKILTGEKKFSVSHMEWFNVDIDEDGRWYQVAFLFSELLAMMFDFHHTFFASPANKEMWYEGPYDKNMIKLKNLVIKLKDLATQQDFTQDLTREIIGWSVDVFEKEIRRATAASPS